MACWNPNCGLVLEVLALLVHMVCGNFDFFIEKQEASRVYGAQVDSDIFYVRDGKVNPQAPNFQDKLLPPSISFLVFHWRMTNATTVAYSIHITSSTEILALPSINTSTTGTVPKKEEAFSIALPCSGKATYEFLVQIKFALFHDSDEETLNFRRKKVCVAGLDPKPFGESQAEEEVRTSIALLPKTTTMLSTSAVPTQRPRPPALDDAATDATNVRGRWGPNDSTTVLALGAAAGTVALLSVLLTVMYVSRRKRFQSNPSLGLLSQRHHRRPGRPPTSRRGLGRLPEIRGNYTTLSSGISSNGSGVDHHYQQHHHHQQQQQLHRMKALTIQGHPVSSRWLSHYSSNQSSIWSSSQTMTSTMTTRPGTAGRPRRTPTSADSTIIARVPSGRLTVDMLPPPPPPPLPRPSQQNSLIMENGIPRLCPRTPKEITKTEEHEGQEVIEDEPFALYSPQVYPHLMPQNFARIKSKVPRSTSGGSVLV